MLLAVSKLAGWLEAPTNFPGQSDLVHAARDMGPIPAVGLVLMGIAFLLFGWYFFKAAMAVNSLLLGGLVGAWIGNVAGATVAGSIMGSLLAVAVCVPAMKYAVSVNGALVGALLGAAVWRIFGQDEKFLWCGAAMGLIALGMLSFILFRGSLIMYTSLQGAVMLSIGILGLIFTNEAFAKSVVTQLNSQAFIMPVAVFAISIAGLLYQRAYGPTSSNSGGSPAPAP